MNAPSQPAAVPALAQLSLRLRVYRWLLEALYPEPAGRRLIDLGAGPGAFARIASRHGFTVTAVDARLPWNMADVDGAGVGGSGQVVADSEFEFVKKDLRDIEDMSDFDVVACIGVLYHLPLADQQSLLERCVGRTVVIDTEVYDPALIPIAHAHRFKPEVTAEGYAGAVCREHNQVYSSYGNDFSFWFDEKSFLTFLAQAGRAEAIIVDPPYYSAFGPRRWYILPS